MIRYKLQNVANIVNTGHTVLYGRVGTCTRISLVPNTPVKFQCIVFSAYFERMAAMTYVLVHVLRNPVKIKNNNKKASLFFCTA